MNPHKNVRSQFAVCVNNAGYAASVALYKIYRVFPDENAAVNSELRVLDESGEEYLYPADHFMPIKVPSAVEQVISKPTLVIQKAEETFVLDLLVSQAEDLGPEDLSMNVDHYLYGLPKRNSLKQHKFMQFLKELSQENSTISLSALREELGLLSNHSA